MATTQADERGVPFAVAHEMQHFRLLELPPEVVELIDTGPPGTARLTIKSQAPSATGASPAYAVLCTPNKTFQLRQVQTSNSLFVTRPALEAQGDEIPVPATRAIASCTATLELHPSDGSPVAYLDDVLPVYDLVDGDVDAAGNGKSKAAIFSHMPLSEGQCEQAWKDMMAFEFAGSSYRPSANTLIQVWKSINSAAQAQGIKLDSQFLVEDICEDVSEEGHPVTLVKAILYYLAADEQGKGGWSVLHRSRTVQFVGQNLLEAKREGPDYLTSDFIDVWKDLLPETFRNEAELNAISGTFDTPSSSTIRSKTTALAKSAETSAPKAVSASRKWHERFGRARQR
jgi:sister chromatid cohesion protein DCC1